MGRAHGVKLRRIAIDGSIITGELTTRADACWKEGFETLLQREKIAKDLYDRHQKEKVTAIAEYRAEITEWIAARRTWEYTLALDLFLAEEKTVV
jgi:hypothetical protein